MDVDRIAVVEKWGTITNKEYSKVTAERDISELGIRSVVDLTLIKFSRHTPYIHLDIDIPFICCHGETEELDKGGIGSYVIHSRTLCLGFRYTYWLRYLEYCIFANPFNGILEPTLNFTSKPTCNLESHSRSNGAPFKCPGAYPQSCIQVTNSGWK